MEKGVGNESLKTTCAVPDGADTKMKTGIKTSNIETYGCDVLPSESDSLKNTLKDASDAMMQNESSFPQSSHDESGNSDNPLAVNGNFDDPSTKDAQLLFQSKEGKEVATDESKSITQRMTENEKTYDQSNNQNEASDSQSKVKIMGDSADSKSSNGHSQPSQVSQISEGSGNHDLSMISDASGNRKETESVDIKERESSVESDDKFDVTSSNHGSDLPRIRSELGPATTGEGSRGISPKWTLWAPEDLGLNGSHNIDHRRRSDGHAYDCTLQPPLSGRKHSSGDLHSRLKTRKLLGVGETDDGDVHRSKLSQILGHSDQLYIRLPSGLRIWQIVLALLFFTMALWAMVFPSHYYLIMFETQVGENSFLPIRMYAIALVSLSLVYWKTLHTSDKDVIRMVLLTTAVFFTLQTVVLGIWWPPSASLSLCSILCQCCLLLVVFVTSYFYWITRTSKDWRQKEVRYYR